MAAFKRPGSKVYYIEPTIEGIGSLGRLSTFQRSKAVAMDMEAMLRELAITGYRDLVLQLKSKDVTLAELWHAKLEGREALDRLRDRRSDPLLSEVVGKQLKSAKDDRVRRGYELLTELAPRAEKEVAAEFSRAVRTPLRLSWLLEPKNLTTLYELACEDLKPNTVRRSLHRAVSETITRRFSRGKTLAVMADVVKPGENDERTKMLTLDELEAFLLSADIEFRPVLGFAVTTMVDKGPFLCMTVGHYDEQLGVLHVPDTKNADRPRALMLRGTPVLENAEYWLRLLIAGKKSHEPLSPLTKRQLRTRWEALRVGKKRTDVRWKDLRGIGATYALWAGVGPKDLMGIMGHADMTMTLRYLRRLPAGNVSEEMRERAKRAGTLGKHNLKVESA